MTDTKRVRTRFAPSPTGYMHIGNLRTALYAYLFAKATKGDFILRIEDTDRARYVADAVDFIKNTLKAAKIVADEGPEIGGDCGPYVQSERMDIYKEYAEKLVEMGHAYRCFCQHSEETEATAEAAEDNSQASSTFRGYNRACRDLPQETIDKYLAEGRPYVIRQKMPLDGETSYFDVLHGNITIPNDTIEDQILLKSDGMPTYNFANVIDDHLMGVTHIIRGAEFITSTPKHVLLYQFFGWELPVFIHLAPVMGKNEDGSVSKLSKRHGATSFDQLTKMGYLPEAIVNYVALLGWAPKNTCQEKFSMEELIEHFSIDGLSKSPAVFDYNKLDWMNGEYFKAMSDEEFARLARPFAGELDDTVAAKWDYVASLLKPRLSRCDEIPEQIAFLMNMPEFDADMYNNKRNKVNPEKAVSILPGAIELLESVDEADWTIDGLNAKIESYVEAQAIKKGLAMWPMRIAISNQKVTPGGVTEILYILGKEKSLKRMKKSLAKLQEIV